ncbi:MAG: hypothetical protein OXQ89_24430 [Rhodospirillaceae bacterium]|nr:hypothetical protein [Rhodospirillaceae bacterium]
MEDTAKDYLASLEELRETSIALGLFAGWALASTCFVLLWWVHNTWKNRRLRIAGILGFLALIAVVNLLIIKYA